MNKLLTIIIPSYNMEKYLERCCSSLVVDDRALMATLEDFDAKMKELAPDLAAIADNFEVKTRLFTYHPYRAYRRNGSFKCWSTFVYRVYIWVAVRLRKVI